MTENTSAFYIHYSLHFASTAIYIVDIFFLKNCTKMNKTVSLFMFSALLCVLNLDSARGTGDIDEDENYPQTDDNDELIYGDPDAECKLGQLRYDTRLDSVNQTHKYEEGDEIVLKCPVCGTEELRKTQIDWLKNNLPSTKWMATFGRQFTHEELKIYKCEQNDTGNYTCTVNDMNGNVISHTYKVVVKKKILPSQFITKLPNNATVKIGDSYSFKCPVSDSSLTVHWFHESNSEHEETTFHVLRLIWFSKLMLNTSEGGNTEELKFSNVSYDDAGWYTCVVVDDRGRLTNASVYLNVTDVPWYSEYWFYLMFVSILGVIVIVGAVAFQYQKLKNARKYVPGNEMTETTTRQYI